jgi:predicted nucleotidyltransferase
MQTWNSFKAQTRDGHFQTAFQAIDAAVRQLQAQHDGAISSIVLFGSLARRRPTYDDIDLLIVTGPGPASMSEVTRRFAEEVFGPLFLEYGELFSFIVYTQDQFARLWDRLPLLAEIQREGILLYGQDPFSEATGWGVSSDRSPSTGDG